MKKALAFALVAVFGCGVFGFGVNKVNDFGIVNKYSLKSFGGFKALVDSF